MLDLHLIGVEHGLVVDRLVGGMDDSLANLGEDFGDLAQPAFCNLEQGDRSLHVLLRLLESNNLAPELSHTEQKVRGVRTAIQFASRAEFSDRFAHTRLMVGTVPQRVEGGDVVLDPHGFRWQRD